MRIIGLILFFIAGISCGCWIADFTWGIRHPQKPIVAKIEYSPLPKEIEIVWWDSKGVHTEKDGMPPKGTLPENVDILYESRFPYMSFQGGLPKTRVSVSGSGLTDYETGGVFGGDLKDYDCVVVIRDQGIACKKKVQVDLNHLDDNAKKK